MSDWFTMRKDVPPWVRWAAPFITWGTIVLFWILLPYWEGPHFSLLPTPLGVIRSFRLLWTEYDLLSNPVAAPMRAMPLTAFLPAFIALFGIDETEKIAFLWFGMFFYLLAVVV